MGSHPRYRPAAALLLALGLGVGPVGCGPVDVTRGRVEASVAGTFGNLYVLQQRLLDAPAATVAATGASAACDKGGDRVPDEQAGDDWSCLISYVTQIGEVRRARYDLQVKTDGCYRADGPPSIVGQQQVPTGDGTRFVTNPLFEFDGCTGAG